MHTAECTAFQSIQSFVLAQCLRHFFPEVITDNNVFVLVEIRVVCISKPPHTSTRQCGVNFFDCETTEQCCHLVDKLINWKKYKEQRKEYAQFKKSDCERIVCVCYANVKIYIAHTVRIFYRTYKNRSIIHLYAHEQVLCDCQRECRQWVFAW